MGGLSSATVNFWPGGIVVVGGICVVSGVVLVWVPGGVLGTASLGGTEWTYTPNTMTSNRMIPPANGKSFSQYCHRKRTMRLYNNTWGIQAF